ncbi:glycosyltransferase [Mesorhizobium sp. BH1-1-4]|uniref:glycosyltransferase n=1 Tax=Mesorhizobium sp. BH1-1-4 TaxID=2876662 RepID=UPI001CD18F50|nr:glycosyltransferase [Mesorhizobium sp. BH1-1-4]MBZ9993109.1 glycosyltransferase family 2 protein [Mesorhizobium sp. BH1-1-4]
MSTIGLCMIVKNEAKVILRCLASASSLADYVLVVDTGSDDGTQDLIRGFLADHNLKGEVIDEPWLNFAYNRTFALERLRERGWVDYAMMIDADDVLIQNHEFDTAAFKLQIDQDLYDIELTNGGISYYCPQLCRNSLPFRYKGILHEYLEFPSASIARQTARGFHIASGREGARSQNPRKYHNDAAVLENALATETDPFLVSRYTFYLAQSYKDCGEREKALHHYLKRAEQGYWIEEVYVALFQAGNLMAALERPFEEVLAVWERATRSVPARAEALHAASRYCRERGRFQKGQEYALRSLGIDKPTGLFIQPWVYDYGLLDEFSVNAYWTGAYQESLDACTKLLATKLPEDILKRVQTNARFAADKLHAQQPTTLAEPGSQKPLEQFRVAAQDVATGGRNEHDSVSKATAVQPLSSWTPSGAAAGTELMIQGLEDRVPDSLARIQLQVNMFPDNPSRIQPLVMWMHHDVNQNAVQWCRNRELVDRVRCFVFVSHWQRERYQSEFGILPSKCVVLRNATAVTKQQRIWTKTDPLRFAYTSTPFRGLSVLLDAWEQLNLRDAELHIWSSMRLYHQDDMKYQPLYARAQALKGVIYHGIAPNSELKSALRDIHFLAYPSTFEETSCLAVVDAMAAGCRVIVPALGALPETTSGFAHVYPWSDDTLEHAALFASAIASEVESPWLGTPEMSSKQQNYCDLFFDWNVRAKEWTRLIESLTDSVAGGAPRDEQILLDHPC